MRLTMKTIKRFPGLLPVLQGRVKSRFVSSVASLRLQVFQTEFLAPQFGQALGFQLPDRVRNASPFREQAKRVLESRELRRFVESETLHGLDLALFYS
jgi:hypothetical protein